MRTIIESYRQRNGLTQQQVANQLHVDKSYISRVESGQREMTPTMYGAGFTSVHDAQMLNALAYEFTHGHTLPTHSNKVYDDHRMSIAYRLQKEVDEFEQVLQAHRLDKHPEHLTTEEKEGLMTVIAELQDVLFEGTAFVSRLIDDYDFLKPQELNSNRDARLRMERRI